MVGGSHACGCVYVQYVSVCARATRTHGSCRSLFAGLNNADTTR